jgi:hypothetical protein
MHGKPSATAERTSAVGAGSDASGSNTSGSDQSPEPPSAEGAWSVAELEQQTGLEPLEVVRVVGVAVRVDVCASCPQDVACAACLAQVLLGDRPDAGDREVLSISGDFFEGQVDFEVGRRYVFEGRWLSLRPLPSTAFAEIQYQAHRPLDSAP